MSRCEETLNPLERDGSNRQQRLVAALDPSFAPVDERDVAELLIYARALARKLVFHPVAGPEATGANRADVTTWTEFIDADISTLVAHVGAYDVEEAREEFIAAAAAVGTGGDPGADLAELLRRIWAIAGVGGSSGIDGWYRRSVAGLQLHTSLGRLIDGSLAAALNEAWSFALRLEDLGVDDVVPDSWPGTPWSDEAPTTSDATFIPSGDPAEDAGDAAQRIVRIHDRFLAVVTTLLQEAPAYLDETLHDYPEHRPHMALYLAFLILLRHARARINETTARHLRFYYEDVLRLDRKAAVPDRTHVVFTLARDAEPHRLAAGTKLKAGKDAGGNDVTFATDSELVVNHARVASLKTVFVDVDDHRRVRNVHAAGHADSADGEGAEITRDDGSWDTFGSTSMPYATIGFAIAAPVLLLEQGAREVTVTLRTRFNGSGVPLWAIPFFKYVVERELRDNVVVEASGEEGWIPVVTTKVEIRSAPTEEPKDPTFWWNVGDLGPGWDFTFRLEVGADADPVVAYDDGVLQDGFPTGQPMLKFVLDDDGPRYAYRYLQELIIDGVDIAVDVHGVTDLLIENDAGPLDPAKPFNPFGATPRVGSNFLVGSYEIFRKRVTAISLHLTWGGLPADPSDSSKLLNLEDYYEGYDPNPVTGNDYFTVGIDILDGGGWTVILEDDQGRASFPLFEDASEDGDDSRDDGDSGVAAAPSRDRIIEVTGEPLIVEKPDLTEFDRYSPTLQRGYVRARLNQDFLHGRYVTSVSPGTAYTLEDETDVTLPDGTGDTLPENTIVLVPASFTPPNPPYTPLLDAFSLDYEAEETIDLTGSAEADTGPAGSGVVYQIWPFGTRAIGAGDDEWLIPEFDYSVGDGEHDASSTDGAGTLYVGLKGLEPSKRPNLTLLIQVAEGTADPLVVAPAVVWSYLADNSWVDFEAGELLADGTNNLTTSGVLSFAIPATMTSDNTVLPAGLHWIKASVARNAMGAVRTVALRTQAVSATFHDQGNVPERVGEALPAGSISKLVTRQAAIKSVTQPAASFGGRVAEADPEYFVRVSERLRHKNRAVTIFDYERIVLEAFPEVYKVRCINHTDQPQAPSVGDASREHAPGRVRLVVIPDLRNKSAIDPLRPRVSVGTLERIRRHVSRLASDFVDVSVTNPDFEEVQVRFSVRFRPGYDVGFYLTRIDQDVTDLLSPWLHGDTTELSFGGRIHRSWVLDAVEDFEYVDFVTDFQIDQIVDGSTRSDVEEAKASWSSTVLVSARSHAVTHDIGSSSDQTRTERPLASAGGPRR